MNLRNYIDAQSKRNVLAPVVLDDTPAPSIKGPAREPRNWWRLGDTSIAVALATQGRLHPVEPKDWMHAGGPGSGRHKEFDGVLKPEDGWKRESRRRQNFWDNRGGLKTVYSKPDPRPGYRKGEQQVRVADNGHWEHVSHTSHVIREGDGAKALSEHLTSIHAGGPGSGCRGDNCGRPKNPGGQLSWDRKVVQREGLKVERKTGRVTIPLQAPPRSQVKTVSHAPAGFIITQLKTPTRGRPTGSGGGTWNLLNRESPQKGSFKLEQENVKGMGWKGTATIWTANKVGGAEGAATSVIALRDVGKMSARVMEIRTEQYKEIGNTNVFKFSNIGQAAGFLKSRYGVSWSLPRNK